ncbi:hydantoinase/oxoprolinase N-terminal domain-containing protein [Pseudonocardia acaciae]|uniref:hydantoinase/oxoprolinase N-terminal domain-containing protein n=1 Tax=Pseudonocardia acaciae TaxID=551276 RepID=UPI00048F6BA7|nr:hydantoinase/oxoprolinase N-terminal domain-containing protein [Pseudonocardia acaciae]
MSITLAPDMTGDRASVRAGLDLATGSVGAAVLRGGELVARRHLEHDGGDEAAAVERALAGLCDGIDDGIGDGIDVVTVATGALREALYEPAELAKVAVIRLAQAGGTILPPLSGWPDPVKTAAHAASATLPGGHDLSGRELAPLDPDAIRRFVERAGVTDVAVCAVGSCAFPDHELTVAELLRREFPELHLTLSHELGGLGTRDRENTAVLNAAVRPRAQRLIDAVEAAGSRLGVATTFVGSDGAMVSAEYLRRLPAVALAGDWAAVCVGAAALTGLDRATVVELRSGRARVGLMVDRRPARPTAPRSVCAIRVGTAIPEFAEVAGPLPGDAPTIVVGEHPEQGWRPPSENVRHPPGHDLAAAIGAAASQPGTSVERLVTADGAGELERAVAALRDEALARVVGAGADAATARIDDERVTPLSYLPRGVHHIVIRAAGTLP